MRAYDCFTGMYNQLKNIRLRIMQYQPIQPYQKKSPREHILLRPNTYVGSIQAEKSSMWVLSYDQSHFQYRDIVYVPALYRIFDEALINAADNYFKHQKMNRLQVSIDKARGSIMIRNNGNNIPVKLNSQLNIFLPDIIFGDFIQQSNPFSDNKAIAGPKNFGAKLINTFSRKLILECGDSKQGLKFRKTWKNNMGQCSQPEVTNFQGEDYVSIQFYPDLERFRMLNIDNDIFFLLAKRVYDMAGLMPQVKVIFNNQEITMKSFIQYANMYDEPGKQLRKMWDNESDSKEWQVIVSKSRTGFEPISFVNGICTTKGGTHVNYITEQLIEKIQEKFAKRDKHIIVKPYQIKNRLSIFINFFTDYPVFDSQNRDRFVLKPSKFNSSYIASDRLIIQILKQGVGEELINQFNAKELQIASMMQRNTEVQIKSLPQLSDAEQAGTQNSQKCTLILAEGDSAKCLAECGLEVIGRKYYGVYSLKGKLPNVREVSPRVIMTSQEIQNIMRILGLQVNQQYKNARELRYGAIMLMVDKDIDGNHIAGLFINMIHFFWPSLFRLSGFIKLFKTPILKVFRKEQKLAFYSQKDYKNWLQTIDNTHGWKTKYYQGLGTSNDKEAYEYFSNLKQYQINFNYQGSSDETAISHAFGKQFINERKQWVSNYSPNFKLELNHCQVNYQQFVQNQLICFLDQNNRRSIASIIDGLKPGERKVLYTCFRNNLIDQIAVEKLVGKVTECSFYHYGEMSLISTIVKMAQNYVGSKNINLLMPNGQFGSRNRGGNDHASAFYLFTCLNKITRYIYPQIDDHILNYIQDNGQSVEPEYFMPIIPMILVNGCDGIGFGWSTSIPTYNPRQIAKAFLNKLETGDKFSQLLPWFKGFIGSVIPKQDHSSIEIRGILEMDIENSIIHIRELPIKKWTRDYKIYLYELIEKYPRDFISLKQNHLKNTVHFQLLTTRQFLSQDSNNTEPLYKLLKLTTNIQLNNLVGFNSQNSIKKYQSTMQIMEEFYSIRIQYYHRRKQYLLSQLQREIQILMMKEKFMKEISEIGFRKKRQEMCSILEEKGFKKYSQFTRSKSTKNRNNRQQNEYGYLLQMRVWDLCEEQELLIIKRRQQMQGKLEYLSNTKIQQLWKEDLVDFLKILDEEQQNHSKQQAEKAQLRGKHEKISNR